MGGMKFNQKAVVIVSAIVIATSALLLASTVATSCAYAQTPRYSNNRGLYILIERLGDAASYFNATDKVIPILDQAKTALGSGNVTLARQLIRDAMYTLRENASASMGNASIARAYALHEAIERAKEFASRIESSAQRVKVSVSTDVSGVMEKLDVADAEARAGNISGAAKVLAESRKLLGRAMDDLMVKTRPMRIVKARHFLNETVEMMNRRIELARNMGLPNETIQALENAKSLLLQAMKIPSEKMILSMEKMKMALARSALANIAKRFGVKMPPLRNPLEVARVLRAFEKIGTQHNITLVKGVMKSVKGKPKALKHLLEMMANRTGMNATKILKKFMGKMVNKTGVPMNATLLGMIEGLKSETSSLSDETRDVAEGLIAEIEEAAREGNVTCVTEKMTYAKVAIPVLKMADKLLEKAKGVPGPLAKTMKDLASRMINAVKSRAPINVLKQLLKAAMKLWAKPFAEIGHNRTCTRTRTPEKTKTRYNSTRTGTQERVGELPLPYGRGLASNGMIKGHVRSSSTPSQWSSPSRSQDVSIRFHSPPGGRVAVDRKTDVPTQFTM